MAGDNHGLSSRWEDRLPLTVVGKFLYWSSFPLITIGNIDHPALTLPISSSHPPWRHQLPLHQEWLLQNRPPAGETKYSLCCKLCCEVQGLYARHQDGGFPIMPFWHALWCLDFKSGCIRFSCRRLLGLEYLARRLYGDHLRVVVGCRYLGGRINGCIWVVCWYEEGMNKD